MPAENSTRETQPPETRGHRRWIDVSAARPVSTSQQTGDGDVKPHQQSDEASQQGTEAQCHVGNDASEHTAETGFSPGDDVVQNMSVFGPGMRSGSLVFPGHLEEGVCNNQFMFSARIQ